MDRNEIEAVYRRYGPMVLRRTRALLGDDSAQDAMQEVFVRAITAKTDFRRDASPMTWLYRIATNYCLNTIRDRTRREELMEENPSDKHVVLPNTEEHIALQQILEIIPKELREVAVYYYVDEMKQEEIADMIGVSRRTVGNRIEELHRVCQSQAEMRSKVAND